MLTEHLDNSVILNKYISQTVFTKSKHIGHITLIMLRIQTFEMCSELKKT